MRYIYWLIQPEKTKEIETTMILPCKHNDQGKLAYARLVFLLHSREFII